jgi:protein-disulfide isomerase
VPYSLKPSTPWSYVRTHLPPDSYSLFLTSILTPTPDLDYVCPFSQKMFKTIYQTSLRKTLLEKYGGRVVTIFRQQIQPWHPSSTLVHEAGYAVQKVDSSKFYDFSEKLFDQQKDFFDISVVNETRNFTYKRLANIASSVGVDGSKVFKLLEISDKPGEDGGLNSGNGVTDDVKVQVKANRLTGVHVTPTVVFDGVVNNEISSGWSVEQWEEWLEKNIK